MSISPCATGFFDFLSNRPQIVKADGKYSSEIVLNTGARQAAYYRPDSTLYSRTIASLGPTIVSSLNLLMMQPLVGSFKAVTMLCIERKFLN